MQRRRVNEVSGQGTANHSAMALSTELCINYVGHALSGNMTDQLTWRLPTLPARTWRVNCGRTPGCCRVTIHNVCGHTSGSGWSPRDPNHYACQHRLTFRCSPCGAIKGYGFITPSSHLCTMDGYHVQNRKIRIFGFSLKTNRNRTGYENIRTITSLVFYIITKYKELQYRNCFLTITLLCRWNGEVSAKTDSLTGCRGVRWPPVIALIAVVIVCLANSSIHRIIIWLQKQRRDYWRLQLGCLAATSC